MSQGGIATTPAEVLRAMLIVSLRAFVQTAQQEQAPGLIDFEKAVADHPQEAAEVIGVLVALFLKQQQNDARPFN